MYTMMDEKHIFLFIFLHDDLLQTVRKPNLNTKQQNEREKKHTQRLQGNHHISSKGDNHNYLIMSINL